MLTERQATALDSRSNGAAVDQTAPRASAVMAAIVGLFAALGPMTLDQLVDAYEVRDGAPKTSPQSVRSRCAELVRRGIVRATTLEGRNRFGCPATVFALAAAAEKV